MPPRPTAVPSPLPSPDAGPEPDPAPGLDATAEPEPAEAPVAEPEGEAPTEAVEAGVEPEVDPFTPLNEVPAPLQAHAKRMQADYTRKTQRLAAERKALEPVREAATVVQRFWTDPQYAESVLRHRAQSLGLTVSRPGAGPPAGNGAGTPPPGAPSPDTPPADYIQRIEARLSPELQWMAPELAAATWAGVSTLVHPLLAKDQQRDQQAVTDARAASLAALTHAYPGWEAHQEDMQALDEWLASGAASHPRFGSRSAFLLKAVAGPGAAVAEAARRMAEAGKARTTTGTSGRTAIPNIADRVRSAKTHREAVQIAADYAIAKLKASGELPAEE